MRFLTAIGGIAVVASCLVGLWYLMTNARFGSRDKSPPQPEKDK